MSGVSGGRGTVVAVCGRPGSGKSAVARGLAARVPGATVVEWDDYETITRMPPEAVAEWVARGADPAEAEAPGLPAALEAARARGPVLFEAPFGRTHPETGRFIDLAVWIEVDSDVALARKLRQLLGGAPGRPPDSGWLDGYLSAYERAVRPACAAQVERVRPLCEVSICNNEMGVDPVGQALALPLIRESLGLSILT